jgi:hypothetical protein
VHWLKPPAPRRSLTPAPAPARLTSAVAPTVPACAVASAEQEGKKGEREATASRDALTGAKGVADLLTSVQKGEVDPQTARDLIASLPGEAGKRGSRSLRRALLQRSLTDRNPWFGLGDEEVALADPSSIRRNRDGSGTYIEPDDGFFDNQREIDFSPEELAQIYGSPDDLDATREDELNIRRRRGF